MPHDEDKIFSVEERLALQRPARDEHRDLQAQEVRVLARIEAAEQLRRAQEEARRPVILAHRAQQHGMFSRIASWASGVQTPTSSISGPRANLTRGDVDQLVAADLPRLYQFRDEIAQELEAGDDNNGITELPVKQPAAGLSVADPPPDPPLPSSPSCGRPVGRWGANRHE